MNHPTRRRLRLPQLNKANRLMRRATPVSEFVILCDKTERQEEIRRDERALVRMMSLRRESAA